MFRSKLFTALFLGMMLLVAGAGRTLADSPQPQTDKGLAQLAGSCAKLANPDQKINIIVQFARTPLQDSEEIRACYDTLTENQKVQVFYRVARKLGLGEKLAEEMRSAPSQRIQPLAYGTLLMPYTAIGSGQMRTAEVYWVDDGNRCPTGRGTEYNFQYRFSTNVTNPASLRSNSPWNILVDGAILWYTVNYGGQKIWYDTDSPVITACVGDTALGTVGGADVWKANAVVYKP